MLNALSSVIKWIEISNVKRGGIKKVTFKRHFFTIVDI
ncbi:hypothetical protein L911_3002 [Vibrio fluvialis I21563]|nr:hypothetical protein L911_3002 [Vibrio fluvialis I21563]